MSVPTELEAISKDFQYSIELLQKVIDFVKRKEAEEYKKNNNRENNLCKLLINLVGGVDELEFLKRCFDAITNESKRKS